MDTSQSQPYVRMYATRFCPYCMRARMLFKRLEVEFEDVAVGSDPELWAEMVERSSRNTVPQIFIDEHHIGGYDDLAAAHRSGELERLLQRAE